jgi:hypothetical protein
LDAGGDPLGSSLLVDQAQLPAGFTA